jgi:hypothetical protein
VVRRAFACRSPRTTAASPRDGARSLTSRVGDTVGGFAAVGYGDRANGALGVSFEKGVLRGEGRDAVVGMGEPVLGERR